MRHSWRLTVGIGVSMLALACQPEKPNSSSSADLEAKLTSGSARTWRLQSRLVGGRSEPIQTSCRADDRWTFRQDGTTTLQNPSPCDAEDPTDPSPTYSGKWRLINQGQFLEVRDNDGTFRLGRQIVQLTDNILTWEYTGERGALVQESWVP
ncbi:MAG: lipocalin family protein [Bacteroidia bacterium]|nr:lipocalin family protein [Bacteroidia bacterium]MDW8088775.1 lipocalin family protein [Bacteroidia bacterium]